MVPPTTDDDQVRSALHEMIRAGQLPPPSMTPSTLRMSAGRGLLPRIDGKLMAAAVAIIALIVLSFTTGPFRHAGRQVESTARSGWTAHSAYGLQISVPSTWSVQVFGQCPEGSTLFIGTSLFVDSCPAFGAATTQVDMYSGDMAGSNAVGSSRNLRVHGLSVVSSSTGQQIPWFVPSQHVVITGSGPKALSVIQSLAPATHRAIPATGKVTGAEYLEALQQGPVSGPVTVAMPASGTTVTIQAFLGQFSFSGKPGRYVLTGHAGNAPCPPVSVTLVSGEVVNAAPIRCQGI
jgi:hypothetical protein